MLTAKEKSAIIRFSMYLAEAQGENGNSDDSVNRIHHFITCRNISKILVECALDMNIMETCHYVSELSEDKKKIIFWEFFEVLIAPEIKTDEAIDAYKAIVKEAQLDSANEWYFQRQKIKDFSQSGNMFDNEKTALATLIYWITPKDDISRPYLDKALREVEQKYDVSMKSQPTLDLYDAIDIVRIIADSKRKIIASEMRAVCEAEIRDNIVYKIDKRNNEVLTEILVETDLVELFRQN